MVISGIPHEALRHTRATQEGMQEGRQQEAASVTLASSTAAAVP